MSLNDKRMPGPFTEIVISTDLAAARKPEELILKNARSCGYSQDAAFAIKLAMEEAITNAVKHGNRSDPNKRITIAYSIEPGRAIIKVRDEGDGFCPATVPDCTADENLDCPTGRGIMLMQAYMNEVSYNDRGNEVTMVKLND